MLKKSYDVINFTVIENEIYKIYDNLKKLSKNSNLTFNDKCLINNCFNCLNVIETYYSYEKGEEK